MAYMSAGLGCRYKLCGDNIWDRPPDPGPRPGNPLHLHLASQHRRVTNTRVWSTSRKNTFPSAYTYWPSHELSHSVSGLHAGWYVRWGLRVDVTLSQHHMLQRYKWSLPWCQMYVVEWYMRSWIHIVHNHQVTAQKSFSHINMPE